MEVRRRRWTAESGFAEGVLEKLADLAAALSDQPLPTVRSAEDAAAIMPIKVLLPTPLPPKMPTRWPRPQVRKASMARTPVPMGDWMTWR